MPRVTILPTHSQSFGDGWGVFAVGKLSERGLEDRTDIYEHLDHVRPLHRFRTREEAEGFVARAYAPLGGE